MLHNKRHEAAFQPYFKPKSLRPRKRRRVTIATGILCSDGVVLCADSLETFRYSKTYGPKIFELQLPQQPFKVVLTGAGDSVFIDALQDKMTSALSLNIGG